MAKRWGVFGVKTPVYIEGGGPYDVELFRESRRQLKVRLSQPRSDNMQSQFNNTNGHSGEICASCGQRRVGPSPAQVLESLPPTAYIRQKLLLSHVVPFSAATLWRKVSKGDFPAPVKLSERVTAWRVSEVRVWLEQFKGSKKR